jgi:hypothetical protein
MSKPLPLPRRRGARASYACNSLQDYLEPGELTFEDTVDIDPEAMETTGDPEGEQICVVAYDYRTRRCYTYFTNEHPRQAVEAFL